MPALTQPQLDAAQVFATASIATLALAGGVHPGTVLAGTARMAGTYLFRSFGFGLPGVEPGQAVLSDKANELGPTLIETAGRLLWRMGITLDSARAGIPAEPRHQPKLSFLDTQRPLERAYAPIRTRYGFDDVQAAYAVAAAVALLINHVAKLLDPHVGFGIAAFGFVEGTKTAPDPVVLTPGSDAAPAD